jgi:hypothetical protein
MKRQMALNPSTSIIKRHAKELLKEGTDFDDDRLDFHDAIMTMGDHDAQVDKLMSDVTNTQGVPSDSIKEQERGHFRAEQRQSYRPKQVSSRYGLDPRGNVTFISGSPVSYSDRTHNQIKLIQQDNASRAQLMSRYDTRFK